MRPASASEIKMETNLNSILSGVLFGGIGMAALFYGRKQSALKPMVIGSLLIMETYCVKSPIWIWLVGAGLTGCLWLFRND